MNKVGIDIVYLERFKDIKDSFVKHVLSNQEMKQYYKYTDQRRIEYIGGRFACKEAIIKSLSDYEMPNMNELVILNNEKGKPVISYKEYKLELSISHEKEYAIAIAILNNE